MSGKLSFLLGPGGGAAAAFFAFKILTRKEVFRFATKKLSQQPPVQLPAGWQYHYIDEITGNRNLATTTIRQIASESGFHFTKQCSHHVLLNEDQVIAQLSICSDTLCLVDDPKLILELSDGDVFLGYLYTWPDFRRRGAAQLLIAMAEQQLYQQGAKRIVTHVRATNVPSLAAFKRLGYQFSAYVISKINGSYLGSLRMKTVGLKTRKAAE